MGDRWGCLIIDRPTRFIAAQTAAATPADAAATAIQRGHDRSGGRPIAWVGDGWHPYRELLTQVYRRPVATGQRGRPPLRVPPELRLTQAVKHRDARGRLTHVAIRATLGPLVEPPDPVHVERLNGAMRDRLNALTRKTHAFAKTTATWDALVGLAVWEHNWHRPHPALRQPSGDPARPYTPRTPAMVIGLTDHPWTWPEFLNRPTPITA